MSATDPNPIPTGSPGDAGAPPFSPTRYQVLVDDLTRTLNAMEREIPFLQQHQAAALPFITAHRSVPNAFLVTTVASIKSEPILQRPGAPATDRGREILQFVEAYTQAGVRVRKFLRNLNFTVGLEKANLAADCLNTYAFAQRLVKDPANGSLGEHVLAMKRDLGRALRKKKGKTPAPSTPPSTPTTPPTPPPSTTTTPASNNNPPATTVTAAAGK